jgi:hypothetical protein
MKATGRMAGQAGRPFDLLVRDQESFERDVNR